MRSVRGEDPGRPSCSRNRGQRAFTALQHAACVGSLLACSTGARADDRLLYAFTRDDGNNPNAGLVQLEDGSFYGTTQRSIFRFNSCGEFKTIVPLGSGDSVGSGLIRGADGSLYGAVETGGSSNYDGYLYRVSPLGRLDTVHRFEGTDGARPRTPVQLADGTFYGVTEQGDGNFSNGSFYRLTADGTLTTLFGFNSPQAQNLKAGNNPTSAIVPAPDGAFYGATASGGANGGGTVFRITQDGQFSVVASFGTSSAGSSPHSLVVAADGTIYGRAWSADGGAVFALTAEGALSTLHGFVSMDGSFDRALADQGGKLVLGGDGWLYGVAENGGEYGFGTVFRVDALGMFEVLYAFKGGIDGGSPRGVIQGTDGHLYGTAAKGGGAAGTGGILKVTVAGAAGPVLPCTSLIAGDPGTNGSNGKPGEVPGSGGTNPAAPAGTSDAGSVVPSGGRVDAGLAPSAAGPGAADASDVRSGDQADPSGAVEEDSGDDGCSLAPHARGSALWLSLLLLALCRRRRVAV